MLCLCNVCPASEGGCVQSMLVTMQGLTRSICWTSNTSGHSNLPVQHLTMQDMTDSTPTTQSVTVNLHHSDSVLA